MVGNRQNPRKLRKRKKIVKTPKPKTSTSSLMISQISGWKSDPETFRMRKRFDLSNSLISSEGCSSWTDSNISSATKSGTKQKLRKRRHKTDPTELGIKKSRCDLNDYFCSEAKRVRQSDIANFESKGISLSHFKENGKFRQMHERVRLNREVLEQRRLEILPSLITMKPAPDKTSSNVDKLCNICYSRPKEATFVHGNISHQVCCYPCAKAIFKQKRTCPVCRRQIEKITKLFCL